MSEIRKLWTELRTVEKLLNVADRRGTLDSVAVARQLDILDRLLEVARAGGLRHV